MSDLDNYAADRADELLTMLHPGPDTIPAAQVYATLALVREIAVLRDSLEGSLAALIRVVRRGGGGLHQQFGALREDLAEHLGPAGALAGFLDEIGVRIAPDGDSVAEAIVGLGGEDR